MRLSLLSMNTKLAKALELFGAEIITAGLSLAPHRFGGIEGHNSCDGATPGCIIVCNLWFSGRTVTEPVRNAAIRRTRELVENPTSFYERLERDLDRIERRASEEGKTPYVRLNVASDLDWLAVIRNHPAIRFYDYSKVKTRCDRMAHGKLPDNYWVTPSFNERMHLNTVRAYLRAGLNVSVVFDTEYVPQHGRIGELPTTWRGMPVVDGDKHDLRHPDYDGTGNIVGLRFKGSRKLMQASIDRGFVVAT